MAAAKSIKTRKHLRGEAVHFMRKAHDFHQSMQWSAELEAWNAVGLAAVHCVISAADAVLVKLAGLRSTSENHSDTADLLAAHVKREGVSAAVRHFEAVLAAKSDVEYSERELLEGRALDIARHAERFFAWADDIVR